MWRVGRRAEDRVRPTTLLLISLLTLPLSTAQLSSPSSDKPTRLEPIGHQSSQPSSHHSPSPQSNQRLLGDPISQQSPSTAPIIPPPSLPSRSRADTRRAGASVRGFQVASLRKSKGAFVRSSREDSSIRNYKGVSARNSQDPARAAVLRSRTRWPRSALGEYFRDHGDLYPGDLLDAPRSLPVTLEGRMTQVEHPHSGKPPNVIFKDPWVIATKINEISVLHSFSCLWSYEISFVAWKHRFLHQNWPWKPFFETYIRGMYFSPIYSVSYMTVVCFRLKLVPSNLGITSFCILGYSIFAIWSLGFL